jgi:hypothetical protein
VALGIAGADRRLGDGVYQRRRDPATGSEPLGERAEKLWPAVVLLVRRAEEQNR